jgi:hypothetical protein
MRLHLSSVNGGAIARYCPNHRCRATTASMNETRRRGRNALGRLLGGTAAALSVIDGQGRQRWLENEHRRQHRLGELRGHPSRLRDGRSRAGGSRPVVNCSQPFVYVNTLIEDLDQIR